MLHYGPIPKFDGADWDLEISGLVEEPVHAHLRGAPRAAQRDVDADMHCVTGWTTLDNAWEGVSFATLRDRAKPHPRPSG